MPACLALLAACDDSAPTEPVAFAPRTLIAGDYDLTATGETVSGAWDTYTIRFEGILSLSQDPNAPSRVSGTFRDVRETDEIGTERLFNGIVTGSIDRYGVLSLELATPSGDFRWTGSGVVVDSQINGQWQSSNPAAGGFSARLRNTAGSPAFSHLDVSPRAVTMLRDEAIALTVVPRDGSGNRTEFPAPVRYSSSAPEVAKVSGNGVVTAFRPGTAVIIVDASSNGVSRQTTMQVTVVEEIDYPDIDGVYVVDAPFTGFDPAWGDFTGYRYGLRMTLQRDERGPGVSGTFTDFQIADAAGKKENWSASGTLRGSIARDGKLTIELTSATSTFTWWAQGTPNGNGIEGRWFRAGHLSGSFRAERR